MELRDDRIFALLIPARHQITRMRLVTQTKGSHGLVFLIYH
jgi:hypothetical protein